MCGIAAKLFYDVCVLQSHSQTPYRREWVSFPDPIQERVGLIPRPHTGVSGSHSQTPYRSVWVSFPDPIQECVGLIPRPHTGVSGTHSQTPYRSEWVRSGHTCVTTLCVVIVETIRGRQCQLPHTHHLFVMHESMRRVCTSGMPAMHGRIQQHIP